LFARHELNYDPSLLRRVRAEIGTLFVPTVGTQIPVSFLGGKIILDSVREEVVRNLGMPHQPTKMSLFRFLPENAAFLK